MFRVVATTSDARNGDGRWMRAIAVLIVMGATLGVSLDVMHVKTGTTAYANPVVFGIALWVFPLFAFASVLFGLTRPIAERLLGWRTPPPSFGVACAGLAFFVAAYLSSGVLPLGAAEKSVVLAAIAIACWALFDRTLLGALLGASAAITGTGFEATIIHFDFFHYVNPDFAGVAVWLPLLYVPVGVGVGNFGKYLVDSPR